MRKSTLNRGQKRVDLLIEVLLILLSLLIIIPLLIMILGSFKNQQEAAQFSMKWPGTWHPENYSYVFINGRLGRAFFNSVVVTLGTLILTIGTSSLAGFILARRDDRRMKRLQNYIMVGLIAPMQMISTFAMLKGLNLLGTYFAVIMVMSAVQIPWAVFMVAKFIRTVPRELDQAALIDGAKPLRMFVSVILPTLKPIMATTTVMVAMTAWNDFMIPLYFFNKSERWTLPLTVYNFFGQYFSSWHYVFANLVITAVPIILLYLYSQKHIVSGLVAGAVKG